MISIVTIILFVVILALMSLMYVQRQKGHNEIVSGIKHLEDELRSIKEYVKGDMQRDILLTEDEKKSFFFQGAEDLNIRFFKNLLNEQIINLIGHFVYSNEDMFGNIVKFQYKHDSSDTKKIEFLTADETRKMMKKGKEKEGIKEQLLERVQKWEGTISGFYRLSASEEWKPVSFWIADEKCWFNGDAPNSITGIKDLSTGDSPLVSAIRVKAPRSTFYGEGYHRHHGE